MIRKRRICSGPCLLSMLGLTAAAALGQYSTSQPTTAPAQQTPIMARVLEIKGDVQHAPLGSDDWQPCQVGDDYPQETVIRTGVRSVAKLQIGDDDTYTALVIESATKTIISEAFQTQDTKRVRIGVGYGRIRAGVAEGGLKSDFTVDSPVATLSKRGTWNFGLFYERGTDRFEVFLLDQGLVEAFDQVTRQRRQVLPREVVNQTMRRWMDQVQLRNIVVPDLLGHADVEVAFNHLQQDGLRVLDPHGGQKVLMDLSSGFARDAFANRLRRNLPPPTVKNPRLRPEGFFGTGRGDQLIPLVFDANATLVQKGLVRPGTYRFRRSALDNWLRDHGPK